MIEMKSTQLRLKPTNLPLLPLLRQQKWGLVSYRVLWKGKVKGRHGDRQKGQSFTAVAGTVPLTRACRRKCPEPCEFKASQSYTVRLEGREEGGKGRREGRRKGEN